MSVPETIETHFHWLGIGVDRVSNIKKINVFREVLAFEGETNRFRGDKICGAIR